MTGCSIQATLLNHSGLLSFEENQTLLGVNGMNNSNDGVEIKTSSLSLEVGVEGGEKVVVVKSGTALGVTSFGVVKGVEEGKSVDVYINDGGKSICTLDGVTAGDVEVGLKINLDGSVEVNCEGASLTLAASA